MGTAGNVVHRELWNKGKLVGQKAPFKLKDIWALRVRLQMEGRVRERPLQPRHRQQTARVRSGWPQGPGRVPRDQVASRAIVVLGTSSGSYGGHSPSGAVAAMVLQ